MRRGAHPSAVASPPYSHRSAIPMVGSEHAALDGSEPYLLPEHRVWQTEQWIARPEIVAVAAHGIFEDPHDVHQHGMLADGPSHSPFVDAPGNHDEHARECMVRPQLRHQVLSGPLKPRYRLSGKAPKGLTQLLL